MEQEFTQWLSRLGIVDGKVPVEHLSRCFASSKFVAFALRGMKLPQMSKRQQQQRSSQTSTGNTTAVVSAVGSNDQHDMQQLMRFTNEDLVFEGVPLLNATVTSYLIRENLHGAGVLTYLRQLLLHERMFELVGRDLGIDHAMLMGMLSEAVPNEVRRFVTENKDYKAYVASIVAIIKRFAGMEAAVDFIGKHYIPRAVRHLKREADRTRGRETATVVTDNEDGIDVAEQTRAEVDRYAADKNIFSPPLHVDYDLMVEQEVQRRFHCLPSYKYVQVHVLLMLCIHTTTTTKKSDSLHDMNTSHRLVKPQRREGGNAEMVFTIACYAREQVISMGSALTYEAARKKAARTAYEELMKSTTMSTRPGTL